ncbi:TPA: hypothetical protein EYN98_00365 [Candidatus Poribacteria bacterium]|nr:hypothetical protein [Candidatus Poribacteria bacterium]
MDIQSYKEEFYQQGFTVIRNCIPLDLIQDSRSIIQKRLSKLLEAEFDYNEGITEAIKIYRQLDIQDLIHGELRAYGVKKKILLQPEILETLIHFIGPDLACQSPGTLLINLPWKTEAMYQKKWHQEVWSGASIKNVYVWTPLSMNQSVGGLDFMEQSHLWGLVPNRNREPTELPDKFEVVTPTVAEGDAIVFHPLTMHRTSSNTSSLPRIAIAQAIRNMYHPFSGLEHHLSWQSFHLSPVAKIERALGNPHLTPFRTLDGSLQLGYGSKKAVDGILE